MKTDTITISSLGSGMSEAFEQVESVASYKGLDHKQKLHLQLLTEETMGLMRSITGAQEGSLWIEDEKQPGTFEIHLKVITAMNADKREALLSASTSGKNDAARGIMGRLRDFFTRDDAADAGFFTPMMSEAMYEYSTSPSLDLEWSLMRYRDEVVQRKSGQDEEALQAWDELEKSVVAHVADEVKVFIRWDEAELVIFKQLC